MCPVRIPPCVPSGSPTVCVQGESTDIPQRVPRENPTNVPWCVPSESPTACAQWESHRCPTHVPRESSQMSHSVCPGRAPQMSHGMCPGRAPQMSHGVCPGRAPQMSHGVCPVRVPPMSHGMCQGRVHRCPTVSFSPLLFASLPFTAICKASPDRHFAFLHFFPIQCHEPQSIVHQAL